MKVTIRSLGDAPLTLETDERPRTLACCADLLRQYREKYRSIFGNTNLLEEFLQSWKTK